MKIPGTKKQKAEQLFKRLEHGPHYNFKTFGNLDMPDGHWLTEEQLKYVEEYFVKHTRIWLSSWITPAVKELLPKELKNEVTK